MFQRDNSKPKAIKTINNKNDWKLYRSFRNAANIALRNAKRKYYATKFLNSKSNPKHAWKTVNEILGRSRIQDTGNGIKLPEKTVTSTRELVNILNDYFTDVGPKRAEKINTKTIVALEILFPQHEPVERITFQPINTAIVYRFITMQIKYF